MWVCATLFLFSLNNNPPLSALNDHWVQERMEDYTTEELYHAEWAM